MSACWRVSRRASTSRSAPAPLTPEKTARMSASLSRRQVIRVPIWLITSSSMPLGGDVAENRVASDGRIEELVRLLDDDDQRLGLVGAFAGRPVGLVDVAPVDPPRQVVGDQYVCFQHVAVPA